MLGHNSKDQQNSSETAAERFCGGLTGYTRDASRQIPAWNGSLPVSVVSGGIACGAVGLSSQAPEGYV